MSEDQNLKQSMIRWECPFINSFAQCKQNPYNKTTCNPDENPICYMNNVPDGGIYDQFYSNPELRNYHGSAPTMIEEEK